MVTIAGQPQKFPTFCALCTLIGRQCPNNYLFPINPEWSDPEEEEKDINKQEEGEEKQEEEEDWDGTIQKQKEEKEWELKQSNEKIPKLDPETMSPLEIEDTEVHTPQFTDTLVAKASEYEEQKNDLCDSDISEFFVDDSDDTIDNIV